MTNDTLIPRRLEKIDWSTWKAVDKATLLFILRDSEVLLIRKRRGLGAGKINAPGGRLDDGESPRAGAIREVFWIADVSEERFLYVSPAYESIWGRARSDLMPYPRALVESIHPDDRARLLAVVARRDVERVDEEYRIVRPSRSSGRLRPSNDCVRHLCAGPRSRWVASSRFAAGSGRG